MNRSCRPPLHTAVLLLIATCHTLSRQMTCAFAPSHNNQIQPTVKLTPSRSSSFSSSYQFHNNINLLSNHHALSSATSSTSLYLQPPSSLNLQTLTTISSTLFQTTGPIPLLPSLLLNTLLFSALRPKLLTMLTPTGYYHSLALGTALWTTLGWRGWTVCVMYLFGGQFVTKVGFDTKTSLGIAEGRGGRRGPENVWGSALTGVICAIFATIATTIGSGAMLGISSQAWILGYIASLSTKLADTFASEIGKAYGRTTFLITSLKPVPRGTEGAISLEGTVASLVGGLGLSLYAYAVVGLLPSLQSVGVSTVAAVVATMVESWIGATLQGKEGMGWMSNEVVNFINTLIGAGIAIGLGVLVLGL